MIEEKLETPKKAVRPEIAGTTEMVKKTVIRKTLGQPVTHMTTEKEITVNPTERMISMKIEVTEEAMDEKMLPDLKHEVRAEMTPEVIPEMIAMAGQEYVLLTLLKKLVVEQEPLRLITTAAAVTMTTGSPGVVMQIENDMKVGSREEILHLIVDMGIEIAETEREIKDQHLQHLTEEGMMMSVKKEEMSAELTEQMIGGMTELESVSEKGRGSVRENRGKERGKKSASLNVRELVSVRERKKENGKENEKSVRENENVKGSERENGTENAKENGRESVKENEREAESEKESVQETGMKRTKEEKIVERKGMMYGKKEI